MNIYEEVKGAKTIGISGHVRPDGDCVGSVMGLYLYLKKLCKDAQIQVMIEKPADIFNCISGVGEICSDFQPVTENFDVFIALDCEKSRLGEAEKFFQEEQMKLGIREEDETTYLEITTALDEIYLYRDSSYFDRLYKIEKEVSYENRGKIEEGQLWKSINILH